MVCCCPLIPSFPTLPTLLLVPPLYNPSTTHLTLHLPASTAHPFPFPLQYPNPSSIPHPTILPMLPPLFPVSHIPSLSLPGIYPPLPSPGHICLLLPPFPSLPVPPLTTLSQSRPSRSSNPFSRQAPSQLPSLSLTPPSDPPPLPVPPWPTYHPATQPSPATTHSMCLSTLSPLGHPPFLVTPSHTPPTVIHR